MHEQKTTYAQPHFLVDKYFVSYGEAEVLRCVAVEGEQIYLYPMEIPEEIIHRSYTICDLEDAREYLIYPDLTLAEAYIKSHQDED